MSAVSMPKFDLKKKGDITDAELAAAAQKTNKYLQPGNHDVKVKSMEGTGASAKDPTWQKIRVTFQGANEATVQETLLVPTASCKFNPSNPKGALFPFQKLQKFFRGIGEDVNSANVFQVLDKYLTKGKLVGAQMNLDIGYRMGHAKYISEGEFQLVDKDGQPYRDKNGAIPALSSRDEAEAYAAEHGLPFQKYSEILRYAPKDTEVTADAEDDTSF